MNVSKKSVFYCHDRQWNSVSRTFSNVREAMQEVHMPSETKRPSGPHSSEHAANKDDLGFDPDSPDLADPQVDPVGPAIAPRDKPRENAKEPESKAYDPLANLKK